MKSDEKTPRRPRRRKDRDSERVFEGLGVAAGFGIGQVHVVEAGAITISEYEIAEDKVEAELERFRGALQKSERQLRKLMGKAGELHGAAAEELGFLLDAHMQMLTGSRVTRGVEQRIAENRQNAEAAVQAVISKVAHDFASLDDAYLAARATDVREVGNRILRNLTQTAFEAFKNLP
ncbi:MAG TPA: phosphoenolpyruvate-utilizing N-terminal domain-containing protein, partial [Alphaproteobacteria bacterium]|nr:phosphoenolpyruvate-utilizing N-terminal domain-containing protein [Alphaproteobacteria bacterium]